MENRGVHQAPCHAASQAIIILGAACSCSGGLRGPPLPGRSARLRSDLRQVRVRTTWQTGPGLQGRRGAHTPYLRTPIPRTVAILSVGTAVLQRRTISGVSCSEFQKKSPQLLREGCEEEAKSLLKNWCDKALTSNQDSLLRRASLSRARLVVRHTCRQDCKAIRWHKFMPAGCTPVRPRIHCLQPCSRGAGIQQPVHPEIRTSTGSRFSALLFCQEERVRLVETGRPGEIHEAGSWGISAGSCNSRARLHAAPGFHGVA